MLPRDMSDEPSPSEVQGFGHTKGQIAKELALIAMALGLLVLGGWWAVRGATNLIADSAPPSVDRTIGENSWKALAPDDKRCTNAQTLDYVRQLADALVPHTDSQFEFEFTVVDDDAVNAFALPGGFVTVNMGLLRSAKSGEEVAGVIAHELAHVTLRHGTRRILRGLGSMALLSVLFGGTDIEAPASLIGGLVNTAYDRDQEAEADSVGLQTLHRAGIDPRGMATFFRRIAEQNPQPGALNVLSTHPDPGDRATKAAEAAQQFTASRSLDAPVGLTCR